MNKGDMINKLEAIVGNYREQLEKHEGSSLSALVNNARSAYDSLRDNVMHSEKARAALETLKEYMEKLEEAAQKGDKALSAKFLGLMENSVAEMKERHAREQGGNDGPQGEGKA